MNCEDFLNKRRKLDLNEGEDPNIVPNTTSQEAFDVLRDHFLGEGWICGDTMGGQQANTIAVYKILKRDRSFFDSLFKRRK